MARMGMFAPKGPLSSGLGLDQGDILQNVLLYLPPVGSNIHQRDGSKVLVAEASKVLNPDANTKVMQTAKKIDFALVVSPSCENVQDSPIELAPIEPFAFSERAKEALPTDQWMEISKAATGGSTPRSFYLPAEASLGLPRSKAMLQKRVSVSANYIDRLIKEGGLKRIGTLTMEAVRHLQWSLNFYYSRNPREDLEWPSADDLVLKIAWLESMVSRGGPFKEAYEAELNSTKAHLEALTSKPTAANQS